MVKVQTPLHEKFRYNIVFLNNINNMNFLRDNFGNVMVKNVTMNKVHVLMKHRVSPSSLTTEAVKAKYEK